MIFGDSMLRHIDAEKIFPHSNSENRCVLGASIEETTYSIMKIRGKPDNDNVTDVLIHCGTNNLPRADSEQAANDIGRTLHIAQQVFKNATIHFSPIIPKKVNKSISQCDKINGLVRTICGSNSYNFIDTRGLFVKNRNIRF